MVELVYTGAYKPPPPRGIAGSNPGLSNHTKENVAKVLEESAEEVYTNLTKGSCMDRFDKEAQYRRALSHVDILIDTEANSEECSLERERLLGTAYGNIEEALEKLGA